MRHYNTIFGSSLRLLHRVSFWTLSWLLRYDILWKNHFFQKVITPQGGGNTIELRVDGFTSWTGFESWAFPLSSFVRRTRRTRTKRTKAHKIKYLPTQHFFQIRFSHWPIYKRIRIRSVAKGSRKFSTPETNWALRISDAINFFFHACVDEGRFARQPKLPKKG